MLSRKIDKQFVSGRIFKWGSLMQRKLPVNTISLVLIAAAFLLFIPNFTHAETKTFVKEYTFAAGEADSKLTSRTVSLREVKRLLLEELGTYLEGVTEVKDFKLTKDQIITLTAGIVSAEIMEETWDGKTYWLKAKISADPEYVIKSIDKLRQDRQKVNELEDMRKRSEALLKENEELRKELASTKGKDLKKAAKKYEKNIDSLTAEEWFDKGYAAQIAGNHNEAVDAYTVAIRLKPDYAEAYNNRGIAYDKLGQYSRAIEDFNQAIRLKPDYAEEYNNRGNAYIDLGQYSRAIEDFNQAIRLKSDYAEAYNNRGIAYILSGNKTRGCADAIKACGLGDCKVYEFTKHKGFCR